MPKNRTQKLITFSPVLYQRALARAKSLGLNFSEYVRYLTVNDIQKQTISDLEILTKEVDQDLAESYQDLAQGKYQTLKTKADIKKFIDQL